MFNKLRQRHLDQFKRIAVPFFAALLWIISINGATPRAINDLGLISILPATFFIAVGVLCASFVWCVNQTRLSTLILLLHVVLLIFMLYGTAAIVEGAPRTAIAWKLTGIIDHVMDYGGVDPARDAFQNWPGFFILAAFVTELAGIESPLALAKWSHVIFNLLYLCPLFLLMGAATDNRRVIWLGIWFFYLSNWIGQDYLAPQAFGYFIYLVIIGIVLTWFRGGSVEWLRIHGIKFGLLKRLTHIEKWLAAEDNPNPSETSGKQQVGLLIMIVAFVVVLAPSHQLSPVAILAAVTALVVFGRITPRGLPIIILVIVGTWISFMTVPYLRGHLDNLTEPLGALTSNVDENVTRRLRGSAAHVFVVQSRILFTLYVWILGLLGVFSRIKRGNRDTNFILLAAVPFSLLALQTYGGELLLRTYIFSLPFVAFFIAALFYPRLGPARLRPTWLVMFAVSLMLGGGFFLARYGNERMDYFSAAEIEAVKYVYAIAEPGSQIVAGNETLPWRFEGYNSYKYSAEERIVRFNNIEELARVMGNEEYPASFLILTRSQKAAAELFIGWPPGTWERFENTLSDSEEFEPIFANQDARVYVLASSKLGQRFSPWWWRQHRLRLLNATIIGRR